MERLPLEIVTGIMRYLNKDDLENASVVNKTWFEASMDPCLSNNRTAKVYLQKKPLTESMVEYINYRKIRSIEFNGFGQKGITERLRLRRQANLRESVVNLRKLGEHVNKLSLKGTVCITDFMMILNSDFVGLVEVSVDWGNLVSIYSSNISADVREKFNNLLEGVRKLIVNAESFQNAELLIEHLPKVNDLILSKVESSSLDALNEFCKTFQCPLRIDSIRLWSRRDITLFRQKLSRIKQVSVHSLRIPCTLLSDPQFLQWRLKILDLTLVIIGENSFSNEEMASLLENVSSIQKIILQINYVPYPITELVEHLPQIFRIKVSYSSAIISFRRRGRVVDLVVQSGCGDRWVFKILSGLRHHSKPHLLNLYITAHNHAELPSDDIMSGTLSELRNVRISFVKADDSHAPTSTLHILKECQKLMSLSLQNCVFGSEGFPGWSKFPALTSVNIEGNNRLKDADLKGIAHSNNNVECVQITHSPLITDAGVREIVSGLGKKLKKLDIRECKMVTLDVVELILCNCLNLTLLEISCFHKSLSRLVTPLNHYVRDYEFHFVDSTDTLRVRISTTEEKLGNGHLNRVRVVYRSENPEYGNRQCVHSSCGTVMVTTVETQGVAPTLEAPAATPKVETMYTNVRPSFMRRVRSFLHVGDN